MWSVTMTDAAQMVFILIGLAALALTVLAELAGAAPLLSGFSRLADSLPADKLTLVPTEDFAAFVGWFSVLAIAILGNVPGQDLTQRMFAARSASIARSACIIAGILYIGLGFIPVLSGLAADVLAVDTGDGATLPALAVAIMSPPMQIVFVLSVTSAVMSTIESAILAPSSVLSNNLLIKLLPAQPLLRLSYSATLVIAAASLGVAYVGQDAYELLETAYAVGMVGLFVPLAVGLHSARGGEAAAIGAMIGGISIWGMHLILGWDTFGGPWLEGIGLPQELAATGIGWATYEVIARRRAATVTESTPA
jgi:Na+/proline symporter